MTPTASYFSDRCGRAVEVRRDTWSMCGLLAGHDGECEPVAPPVSVASSGRVSGTPERTPSEPGGKDAGDEPATSTSGSLGAAEAGKAEALAETIRAHLRPAWDADVPLTDLDYEAILFALDALKTQSAVERARAATAETARDFALIGLDAAIQANEVLRMDTPEDEDARKMLTATFKLARDKALAAAGGAAQPEGQT